jgi:hypothetical protein
LNFDEQILEAAKSITNAAGALIKAATAAQKELVAQGKVNKYSAILPCLMQKSKQASFLFCYRLELIYSSLNLLHTFFWL